MPADFKKSSEPVIEVGHLVRSPTGHTLLTSAGGAFTLVGNELEGDRARIDFAVITGFLIGAATIQVTAIDEMMTDADVRRCANFLAGRYGGLAAEHAAGRLAAARQAGNGQQAAVWQAVLTDLETVKKHRSSLSEAALTLDKKLRKLLGDPSWREEPKRLRP